MEQLKKQLAELQEENKQLQKRLETLEKLQKQPAVPEWAKAAVDAAVKSGLVANPEGGSYDFYRLVTILHRAGVVK